MVRARMVLGGLGVVALCVATAVAPSAPVMSAVPAAAQESGELTLTMAQTTGLSHGQFVDGEVGNIPATEGVQLDMWFCDDPVELGTEWWDVARACDLSGSLLANGATEAAVRIRAMEMYYSGDPAAPPFSCVDEPFDCAAVVTVTNGRAGPVTHVASVPVDLVPSPLRVLAVDLFGEPLGPVAVFVSGDPGANLQLAQCVAFTDVPRDLPNCIAGPQVTLSEHGRGHTVMTPAATQTVAGTTYDCLVRPCEVVVFDAGTEVHAATIPGSYPAGRFELSRSVDVHPGETVRADVHNGPDSAYLGECIAAVIDGSVPVLEGCMLLDSVGAGDSSANVELRDRFSPFAGGPELVCAEVPGGCIVGLGDAEGRTAWYQPISFAGPVSLTLTPDQDLVDGEEITASMSGLLEGRTYGLFTCRVIASTPSGCLPEGQVTGPALGTASATVVARQRYVAPGATEATSCRDGCEVVMVVDDVGAVSSAEYSLSTGSLTATPSTGLSDGETITVSGTGVQPTYDGPMIWIFHTGPWVLAQCGAGVVSDPTLAGVFTNCTTAVGGPVDVPASGFSQPVAVAATIDPILGGTTDCTTGPGACVMMLGRVEEDATVTVLTTPLTFTPPSP